MLFFTIISIYIVSNGPKKTDRITDLFIVMTRLYNSIQYIRTKILCLMAVCCSCVTIAIDTINQIRVNHFQYFCPFHFLSRKYDP